MRKLAAAALIAIAVSAAGAARADSALDIGTDAIGVDVELDASLEVSLDASLDSDDAAEAADADPDTAVIDTSPPDTASDTGLPEAAPDTAPLDTGTRPDTITPIDSAGPIVDIVSDGGWDPRGRTDRDADACSCEVVGRPSTGASLPFLALLGLVGLVRARRR